ncbi:hypothetical protein [Xanthobacter autotrophicus]|uniref:hypothetical protein n=1 Tax=Xanthobacter autotrophicus TaxID=280 RepID=UPI00372C98C5
MPALHLFETPADVALAGGTTSALALAITLDTPAPGPGSVIFSVIEPSKGTQRSLKFPVKDPGPLDAGSLSYDTLTRVITLQLDLTAATSEPPGHAPALDDLGLAGLSLQPPQTTAFVRLRSLTIVLRPRPPGGDWDVDTPCFSIIACWIIGASAGAGVTTTNAAAVAGATMEVEVCVELAAIRPEMPEIGLPNLQLRLEAPSFGLMTDWAPLGWFEVGDWPFRFDGLVDWFLKLTNFDLPGFTPPELDWQMNLPVSLKLPLGLSARRKSLRLSKQSGKMVIEAIAELFYLTWNDHTIDLPASFKLRLAYESTGGRYVIEATVGEWTYPAPKDALPAPPYAFALPFDMLGVQADCWRLRLGLYGSGGGGGKFSGCFDVLLEVGGLTLSSVLGGDDGGVVYRTDLRLQLRDLKVIVNKVAPGATLTMFDGVPPVAGSPFARYADVPAPAYSFAQDLLAPPATGPANQYGMTFLDGDVGDGPSVFLAWEQQGLRFLKALGHDLLGSEPAGAVPPGEKTLLFALEAAKLGGIWQLRLDWRDKAAQPLTFPSQPPYAAPKLKPGTEKGDVCIPPEGLASGTTFPIPLNSPGAGFALPRETLTFRFPAIELEIARPDDQAIILCADPDRGVSASHLLIYPPRAMPLATPEPPAAPLAVARVGFSLTDRSSGGDARDVIETAPTKPTEAAANEPFIAVGLGRKAWDKHLALRTIGWRSGSAPRFLEVPRAGAQPITPLIDSLPALPAAGDPGCPGPAPIRVPPARLDFDSFGSPKLGNDDWRLGVRLAALDQLFKLFPKEGSGQRVSFLIKEICQKSNDDTGILIKTSLTFALGDFTAAGDVTFRFDVRDLSLSIADGANLAFRLPAASTPPWAHTIPLDGKPEDYWYSVDRPFFGLSLTALQSRNGETSAPAAIDVLTLSIDRGRFLLALPPNRVLVLRYDKLGGDSLNFLVDRFELGPGGVDLDATLVPAPLRLAGLSKPFALDAASLRMRSSRLEHLSIDASGALPEILDNTPVRVAIAFQQPQAGAAIELADLVCELGNKGTPILSRGTRFKFEIEQLGLHYAKVGENGQRKFFFEVTGSAQFTPDDNEFTGGLLEDFKSVRIEFIRAPLADEFIDNLKFVVELRQPKVFKIFDLFRMEIRSIGFAPHFDGFAHPGPAVIIGGQCEFADIGDVVSAKIDFHAMYIGLPAPDEVLPQIHFDGLRVDISTPEGFRIAGRVDRYDSNVIEGFAGEGTVQVPGFPELSAAFAFVKVRRDETQPWKRAWFIAIEAAKISYQLAPLPIYLRQIGLGFGYRYTITLVKEFRQEASIRELLGRMLRALDQHQTLARIDTWTTDIPLLGEPEQTRWTIAMEAVFTVGSSQATPFDYDAEEERKVKTLVAQIIAAFRSDFTLVAAAKLWFPVSVDDFFHDKEGMRRRPLASGFMIYSAPQRRFLAHAAKGADPYMGPEGDPVPEVIKDILRGVHFEATVLIEPGLFHAELGWPDRLMFRFNLAGIEVECRGGVLFRLERELMIQGVYFSARGNLDLSAGVDFGFVGARIEARATIQYAARMMIGTYPAKPLSGVVYYAVGMDIAVQFRVSAWLRIKAGPIRISFSISFSLEIQIVVAMEMGWVQPFNLGFRARANVLVSVFGRRLSIHVAVGVNEEGVQKARDTLGPYMGSLLEAGKAPAMPGFDKVGLGDREPITTVPFVTSELAGLMPGGPAAALIDLGAADDDLAPVIAKLAKAAPTADDEAKAEADDEKTRGAHFVTSHVDGVAAANGERLWFVWIMPGPGERLFYPPTKTKQIKEKETAAHYAELDFSEVASTAATIYVPKWTGARLEWTKVDGKHVVDDAVLSSKAAIKADDDAIEFNLNRLLAGCWTLKDVTKEEIEERVFPFHWPEDHPELKWESDGSLSRSSALRDDRAVGPDGRVRGPKAALDVNHAYDRALAAAASKENPPVDTTAGRLRAQMRGNQGLVLQGMHDDLIRIANATCITGTGTTTGVDTAEAYETPPWLVATGMMFCVKAKEKPDWIGMHDAKRYPKLRFLNPPAIADTPFTRGRIFSAKPVIDFEALDFVRTPPNIPAVATYFDEEALAVSFDIDWAGAPPTMDAGAHKDIEAYIRCYEVELFDLDRQSTLRHVTVSPAELLVEKDKLAQQRLRTRYQYVAPAGEIVPKSAAGEFLQTRVGVNVTPISQTGARGLTFTSVANFEPTLTPLPPDDLKMAVTLYPDKPAPKHVSAVMSWRQLTLPSTAGVATTRDWQLVLRPLRTTPHGAYPDETIDVTDRGLMSVTGQALIDGDVVILLSDAKATQKPGPGDRLSYRIPDPKEPDDMPSERDPADRIYTLNLDASAPKNWLDGKVFDHLGRPLASTDPLRALAAGFFDRASAGSNGKAWRLYLRAAGVKDDKGGPFDGSGQFSGLVPVQFHVVGTNKAIQRTLPHFEWPTPAPALEPLRKGALSPRANAKPLHVGIPDFENGGFNIRYVARPGRTRMISLEWNTQSSDDLSSSVVAQAAYDVFERRLETMVNADADPDSGFDPGWRHIKRVTPVRRAIAAQTPENMADTPNWEAQTPVFVWSRQLLERRKVKPQDMASQWPGYFSWAESQLVWPPQITLPTGPATAEDAEPLGKWLELGADAAGGLLHGYLATIIGRLVDLGGRAEAATYHVEIAAAPPSAIADPLNWLRANTEEIDPYGWAALERLGLSIVISLRDPFTGLLLPPDVVLDKTQKAITDVNGAVVKEKALSLARHLHLDVPLQNARAYRASEGGAGLQDAGLAMLQLSLRPLPEPTAEIAYEVIKFAAGKNDVLKTENDSKIAIPHGVLIDIVFVSRGAPDIEAAHDEIALHHLIGAGDLLLVRRRGSVPAGWSLRVALKNAEYPLEDPPEDGFNPAQEPLAILAGRKVDIPLEHSPFGRFSVDPEFWSKQVVQPPPKGDARQAHATSLTVFLDYLETAFRQLDPKTGKTPPLGAAPWRLDLVSSADTMKAFRADYVSWSGRLFAAGPIGWAHNTADPLSVRSWWTSIAQPKTVEPLRIASDARGRLMLNRLLEEEWAGECAFTVLPVGRYEALWRAVRAEDTGLKPSDPIILPPAADSEQCYTSYPRIRQLQPPDLILARTHSAPGGARYHEIAVVHGERNLARNMAMQRKLAFGEIWRSYTRRFAHWEWAETLESSAVTKGTKIVLPRPLSDTTEHSAPFDATQESALTLLAVAPEVRWKAQRYFESAEPFYYEQTINLAASADTDVWSEKKTTVLPRQDPDPLLPRPEAGKPASALEPLSWNEVEADKVSFAAQCRNVIDEVDPTFRRLIPDGWSLKVRMPRLIESLDPASLLHQFRYEAILSAGEAPVGMLPDPDTRILIYDETEGVKVVLAQIEANSAKKEQAFITRTVSSDIAPGVLEITGGETWPSGVVIDLPLPPKRVAKVDVIAPEDRLAHPDTLPPGPPVGLLKPSEWPNAGPLLRLAPLALRLTVDATGIAMINPLPGGNWLARPSIVPGKDGRDEKITASDLAVGIRLVVDVERRRAAALVAHDAGATAASLLARIENAALAIVLKPQVDFPNLPVGWPAAWKALGVTLWRRVEDGTPRWVEVEAESGVNDDEHVAIFDTLDAGTQAMVIQDLNQHGLPPDRAIDAGIVQAINEACLKLADAAHRDAAIRKPVIYAQRGNAPITPWTNS